VTAWASLTWQAADPSALAADLERRLGTPARANVRAAGAWVLGFGGTDLEIVPWRREAPDDDPHAGGRLVFEPVDRPEAAEPDEPVDRHEPVEPDDAIRAIPARLGLRLVAVAWATVELDRAEQELDPWLGPAAEPPSGPEPHLGARTRTRRSAGLPGAWLVLAEPVSEGRLAASLARDGEGPCALYLEPAEGLATWIAGARRRGVAVSPVRSGPLGDAVLVGGVASGPHLVIVDRPAPSAVSRSGSTITP
jgi:hypothetical protein